MQDVLKTLNFASWFDLYQYLKSIGWHDRPRVRMHPPAIEEPVNTGEPPRRNNHPIELDLVEIKARAFDEIYPELPGETARELMLDVAQDLYRKAPGAEILVFYFNKLKVRK